MKKLILLAFATLFVISCRPVKISDIREVGTKNNTCVLFFSNTINYPIQLSIDDQPVPIALPMKGKQLEIHNLSEGSHTFSLKSNYYIFSEPIRKFNYSPADGKNVLIFAVLKYRDKTAPNREELPGFWKRTWNGMLFWRKKSVDDRTIDTSGMYGEFTD